MHHGRAHQSAIAKEIAPARLGRREACIPDRQAEFALKSIEAPALRDVQYEVAVDESFGLGVDGDRVEGIVARGDQGERSASIRMRT
jgi:hypothetical protein